MNYGKYDTIYCKRCFYFLDCNEFPCINPKTITNNKKYNEYNYNPAAIILQCIFV